MICINSIEVYFLQISELIFNLKIENHIKMELQHKDYHLY